MNLDISALSDRFTVRRLTDAIFTFRPGSAILTTRKQKERDLMPLVNSREMFRKAYEGGYAIGAFNVNNMEIVQAITEAGKLENTLIVATGDHIPYSDVDVLEELAGKKFGTSEALSNIDESAIDFDVYKNTLIMWSASMEEPVQVDKVCCQVDILPTVSNLLGLEYDSRMLAGRK